MTQALSGSSTGSGEAGFCATQARREQNAADDAMLENVRVKHQRAADTWTSLANRAAARIAARDAKAAQNDAAQDDSGRGDIARDDAE